MVALTWGQLAYLEYAAKNFSDATDLVLERRWPLPVEGQRPNDLREATQELLRRHDLLWTTIHSENLDVSALSNAHFDQSITNRRITRIDEVSESDEAAINSWRESEQSPWDGGRVQFFPRVLILTQRDQAVAAIVRAGHHSIDAASFSLLHHDAKEIWAGSSITRPAITLTQELSAQLSREAVKSAQRSREYLHTALVSSSPTYLVAKKTLDDSLATRASGCYPISSISQMAQSLAVSTGSLLISLVCDVIVEKTQDADLLFKSLVPAPRRRIAGSFVGPSTRTAVVRTNLSASSAFEEKVSQTAHDITVGYRYSTYDPRELWLLEEQVRNQIGESLKGQVLFNVRRAAGDSPRLRPGETQIDVGVPLSYDQKLIVDVELYEESDTFSISFTCGDFHAGNGSTRLLNGFAAHLAAAESAFSLPRRL